MSEKKCKDIQKVKRAKHKKIEVSEDTDEEKNDKIVEEEIEEEEENDEEENTDENKGEPIHFEEERKFTAECRIPRDVAMLENFRLSKQRRGDCW